jgi:cell division protein FtsW
METVKKPKTGKQNILLVGNYDYIVFTCIVLLALIGVVMVFSSSYYEEAVKLLKNSQTPPNVFKYLIRQGIFAAIGFCCMALAANFNYRYLKNFTLTLYGVSIFLLVLVLFIGKTAGGSTRWINLGFFQIQPSEIAKLAVILHISYLLSNYRNMLKTIWGYAFIGAILIAPVLLIGVENGSTALIVAIIGAALIFITSPHTLIILLGGGVVFAAGIAFLFFAAGFRMARFAAWLDPFSDPVNTGYQIIQSLYAISSGGLFGLGLGRSRQKLGFIPEAQNDMIFSIICEELGFFGAALILLLFGIFIWRGIKIALNSSDLFGSLIASGIVVVIAVQVKINVAVATNSVPNTGIPLPFISYGGTALIVFMTMSGILLNISRYSKE